MNNSEILVNVKKKDLVKEQIQVVVTKTNPMQNLASKLLHSQSQAHVFHLQTKSFAEHKALQGFYEDIDDLLDSLIESYQGQFGIIQNYDSFPILRYDSKEQVIAYFEELMGEINMCREGFPSHLQNIIDTIIELITSTLYKLKFLN